jgi:uncharacterized membrane protein HdeD (DUF308 family)
MRKLLRWLLPLAGLWIIGLGIVTIFNPLANLATMAFLLIMFGVGMIFSGISEVIGFIGAGKGNRTGMMLASGLLTTLFGVWMIFGRGLAGLAIILPFIFAAWVMSSGITRIVESMPHKADGRKFRFLQFVFGLITAVTGFAMLFNPFLSASVMLWIMPIMLISYGMGTIELFFRLRKADKSETNPDAVADNK